MEFIIILDKTLQLPVVRWFLLVSTLALMIAAGIYKSSAAIKELQIKALKGDIATYAAHIEAQNTAVIKAGADYEQQKKKAMVANEKAAALKRELERLGGITIVPGSCEIMVMQAINEVRRGN